MELELKQIGQTIAVGAYTLICLRAIILVFDDFWLFQHFRIEYKIKEYFEKIFLLKAKNESIKFIQVGAYTAIIYVFGLLLEDYSKEIFAEREEGCLVNFIQNQKCPLDFNKNLPSDKILRFNDFFKVKWDEGKKFDTTAIESINFSTLSEKYYRIGLFNSMSMKKITELDSMAIKKMFDNINLKPIDSTKSSKIDSLIILSNDIYYFTKNRVFEKDNYFNEIQVISLRNNFAGSFTFINFIFQWFVFWFFIIKILIEIIYRVCKRKKDENSLKESFKGFKKCFKPAFLFVLFVIFVQIGSKNYIAETKAFHNRVYGYYWTMIIKD